MLSSPLQRACGALRSANGSSCAVGGRRWWGAPSVRVGGGGIRVIGGGGGSVVAVDGRGAAISSARRQWTATTTTCRAAPVDDVPPPALTGGGLAAPSRPLMRALTSKERAALRTEAETMARDKKLVQVQVGAAGVTRGVLAGIMDALVARGFVRVRLGVGGSERKSLAAELAGLLDAAVVHQVGHTATLYRTPGLARPEDGSCSGRSASSSSSSSANDGGGGGHGGEDELASSGSSRE